MFKSAHAAEIAIGAAAAGTSGMAGMLHDLIPLISTIGVLAGTFVALHGTYKIVREWLHARKWPRN